MENKCLYCYELLEDMADFHEKCSRKLFGSATPPQVPYSLDQMTELAKNVVEHSISVPGVQPKLSISVVNETREKANSRLTVVGALGGQYILKPPSEKFPEMPENEHVTMRIAEAFGIHVVPSGLIRLASGELSYITKRIDRTDKGRKSTCWICSRLRKRMTNIRVPWKKWGKRFTPIQRTPCWTKSSFLSYRFSVF